jgi:hypothetical protein
MRDIAQETDELRRDLFQETAAAMRVHPAITEKDFWVCWALDFLFHNCGNLNTSPCTGSIALPTDAWGHAPSRDCPDFR